MDTMNLIGPFSQIIPLHGLPAKGPIADDRLDIIRDGGVVIHEGRIKAVGPFGELAKNFSEATIEETTGEQTLLPGFIDCHTHICCAGSRARDYAMRVAGENYLAIAKAGGGIWDTVVQTRQAPQAELASLTIARANRLLGEGVTTIEVKSGYGLDTPHELNMLRAIALANQ